MVLEVITYLLALAAGLLWGYFIAKIPRKYEPMSLSHLRIEGAKR